MSQVNIHIDPLSTDSVLKHLGLAIEEIKLMRSIDHLNELLRLTNTLRLEPGRRESLAAQLRELNEQLVSLRERARNKPRLDPSDRAV